MAHRLEPHSKQAFLSPDEVLERLRDEFRCVEADREAGADHVGDMIAALLRMKAGQERRPVQYRTHDVAELDRTIARLEQVREQAISVSVGDDSATEFGQVNFAIVPEEPLLIGYSCRQHEDVATGLSNRIATVLNYAIRLV